MNAVNPADVGKFFKRMRKENNLTQQNVADRLLVSPQAVSKWERGECLPDITLLPEIARLYGVSVAEILEAGETGASRGEGAAADELRGLLRRLNAFVSDALFARVLDMLKTAGDLSELSIPPQFFMVLNTAQKDALAENLLAGGNASLTEELFLYLGKPQREKIVRRLAEESRFAELAELSPYITAGMKMKLLTEFDNEEESL